MSDMFFMQYRQGYLYTRGNYLRRWDLHESTRSYYLNLGVCAETLTEIQGKLFYCYGTTTGKLHQLDLETGHHKSFPQRFNASIITMNSFADLIFVGLQCDSKLWIQIWNLELELLNTVSIESPKTWKFKTQIPNLNDFSLSLCNGKTYITCLGISQLPKVITSDSSISSTMKEKFSMKSNSLLK